MMRELREKMKKKIKNMEMKAGEGRRSSFFVFAFSLPYRAQSLKHNITVKQKR